MSVFRMLHASGGTISVYLIFLFTPICGRSQGEETSAHSRGRTCWQRGWGWYQQDRRLQGVNRVPKSAGGPVPVRTVVDGYICSVGEAPWQHFLDEWHSPLSLVSVSSRVNGGTVGSTT